MPLDDLGPLRWVDAFPWLAVRDLEQGDAANRWQGSAQQTPEVERIRLHPLNWEINPPTEVTLRVSGDYVPDVVRWLREPDRRSESGDEVEMTYVVTHRAAFRARIYQLGTRVQIVSPEEFRDEVLTDLRHLVGL